MLLLNYCNINVMWCATCLRIMSAISVFYNIISYSLSSCDMGLCYFIYIFDLSTLQGPSKLWDKHAISIRLRL